MRPQPPKALVKKDDEGILVAAPDCESWLRKTFLDDSSRLYNAAHKHLKFAQLGVLWTNVPNERQMRTVVGQAELCKPPQSIGKWARAAWHQQHRDWFGHIPNFKITLYAPYVNEADDASLCALVEHELYHCALLRFTSQGVPMWGMRGHDVEEFVGIVERYGVGAAAEGTGRLIEASKQMPKIAQAAIAGACGTCALKLA